MPSASRARRSDRSGGEDAGRRPGLTVAQILAWADAHRDARGEWPDAASGPVDAAPGETWADLDAALGRGDRGLEAGRSLAYLLALHRGVPWPGRPIVEKPIDPIRAWEEENFPLKPRRAPRRPAAPRPDLSAEKILRWADAHHAATGKWPTAKSGPVTVALGETWGGVNNSLVHGLRGLSGSKTLADLLQERRGVRNKHGLPRLTEAEVLAWADAHQRATGDWPDADSGPIAGAETPGETWGRVNAALVAGLRGLAGGTSLADLLLRCRGVRHKHGLPRMTIDQILAWADAHLAATGRWPTIQSGPVAEAPEETWNAVQSALFKGLRGLPGGSSLAQVLAEHRGARPRLSVELILAWADAHHDATGEWPLRTSGRVLGMPGETWQTVDMNLIEGRRGLPGGSTLPRLLAEHRPVRNAHTTGPLSVELILAWADAHRDATGRWPDRKSGPVRDAPGEAWSAINSALYEGRRGLPGKMSLAGLILAHRDPNFLKRKPDLTVEKILAWADAHHASHGRWPTEEAGPVDDAPDETWGSISQSLAGGKRGLPGGSSLARLLAERRGARNPKALPRLTLKQILAWADAHLAATGRWPSLNSGPVPGAPGEEWSRIDSALKGGHRGLRGDSSLARLLDRRRPSYRAKLSMARIRRWAIAHREATGRWPDAHAGAVLDAPGEDWHAIDVALRHGRRGLPGGTTLGRLFGRSLDPEAQGQRPPLTVAQILAWADAHHEATGQWPTRSSGPIPGAPGEKWVNLDMALKHGRRGLPAGRSLARFLAEHRGATPPSRLGVRASIR